MKKFTAVVTALCLMLSTATAETSLRVVDAPDAAQGYLAQYPDRSVTVIQSTYDQALCRANTQELLLAGDWDIAFLDTRECDLNALDQAGLLMDLSGVETASEAAGKLYAPVRDTVVRDGRLIGLPVLLWGLVMQLGFQETFNRDDWANDPRSGLGFTDADTPHTFADLCALAQRYMALPAETRRGTVFCSALVEGGSIRAYYLYYLISLYTAETCDADGRVDYDTALFREALADLEAMTAAFQANPKITYGENGEMYTVTSDLSSSVFSQGALYLHVGESDAVPACMTLAVVNANTPLRDEALDYLALALQDTSPTMVLQLYAQVDYDALLKRSYDEDIAAQVEQGEAQSVIDELIRLRDAGDDLYFYPREQAEAYAENVAPRLTFPHVPRFDASTAVEAYARGTLDADGLIAALTELTSVTAVN